MADCCHSHDSCSADSGKRKFDYILWISGIAIALGYIFHFSMAEHLAALPQAQIFAEACFELLNEMWWGVALGIVFVGLMSHVPRDFVMSAFGRKDGIGGILRATTAGLLLDMCNHGILLIGMKLYERGATLGQTMAFLIASPWNSLTLTVIMLSLIGVQWTVAFIVLSAIIAILSGYLFELLVRKGTLPENPNRQQISDGFKFFPEAKRQLSEVNWRPGLAVTLMKDGWKDSTMILRWIFFGIVLAASIRAFVPPDAFQTYFGPTLAGLGLTIVVATILEICSEGTLPVAADILTRAGAPGNSFTFLMTGVSTDYTEIMALKETTKSWKIAFFLPLVTVPQVIMVGVILNMAGAG